MYKWKVRVHANVERRVGAGVGAGHK